MAIPGRHHALLRYRQQLAVVAREFLLAVHRGGTGHQPLRIDHVRRRARVRDQLRVGQLLHQQARATGVVEVGMGQHHPVHRIGTQARVRQRLQQQRHAVVGPAVDESRPALLDHQVGGAEGRPDVPGVEGMDAVRGRRLLLPHG
jgi:hypothetical protein